MALPVIKETVSEASAYLSDVDKTYISSAQEVREHLDMAHVESLLNKGEIIVGSDSGAAALSAGALGQYLVSDPGEPTGVKWTNLEAHTHSLSDISDVTATAAQVNLLDLSGLTTGWVLAADTATTASWRQLKTSELDDDAGFSNNHPDITPGSDININYTDGWMLQDLTIRMDEDGHVTETDIGGIDLDLRYAFASHNHNIANIVGGNADQIYYGTGLKQSSKLTFSESDIYSSLLTFGSSGYFIHNSQFDDNIVMGVDDPTGGVSLRVGPVSGAPTGSTLTLFGKDLPAVGGSVLIGLHASGTSPTFTISAGSNVIFVIEDDGKVTLDQYGVGTFPGTPTRYAAWNLDGEFIERTPAEVLSDIGAISSSHTHILSEVTDVTASPAEVNLLDLSGLNIGDALLADGPSSAAWRRISTQDILTGGNAQEIFFGQGLSQSSNLKFTGDELQVSNFVHINHDGNDTDFPLHVDAAGSIINSFPLIQTTQPMGGAYNPYVFAARIDGSVNYLAMGWDLTEVGPGIEFGIGGARDVKIGRFGTNTLKTPNDMLIEGGLELTDYGIGTRSDTNPAYYLSVQADGDVVETSPSDLLTDIGGDAPAGEIYYGTGLSHSPNLTFSGSLLTIDGTAGAASVLVQNDEYYAAKTSVGTNIRIAGIRGDDDVLLGAIDNAGQQVIIMEDGQEAMVIGGKRFGFGADQHASDAMYVENSTAAFRMVDTSFSSDYLRLAINGSTFMELEAYRQSGASYLLLDPKANDGTSRAEVRVGRNSNTTGDAGIRVHIANGTVTDNAFIAGNADSYVCANNGSFGIGISTPGAKLDVDGGSVRFSDYGIGTYSDTNPAYYTGFQADGDVIELTAAEVLSDIGAAASTATFYANDGTLTGNRTVTTDGNNLIFSGSGAGAAGEYIQITGMRQTGTGNPALVMDNTQFYGAKTSGGVDKRLLGISSSNDVLMGAIDSVGGTVQIREDGTTYIRIEGGNVGIGNNVTADNMLHVERTDGVLTGITAQAAANEHVSMGTVATFGPSLWWEGATSNDLRFGTVTDNDATGYVERFRMKGIGYFGIGLDPSAPLHVYADQQLLQADNSITDIARFAESFYTGGNRVNFNIMARRHATGTATGWHNSATRLESVIDGNATANSWIEFRHYEDTTTNQIAWGEADGDSGEWMSLGDGQLNFRGATILAGTGITTSAAFNMELGASRTVDGNCIIDLHGDESVYSDYGLRIIRWSTGYSELISRGTTGLRLRSQDAAPVDIYTNSQLHTRFSNESNDGYFIVANPVNDRIDLREDNAVNRINFRFHEGGGIQFYETGSYSGASVRVDSSVGNHLWLIDTTTDDIQISGNTAVDRFWISANNASATSNIILRNATGTNVAVKIEDGPLQFDAVPTDDHKGHGIQYIHTAAENLVFGDVCYINSSGKMAKGDASGASTTPVVAMSLETTSTDVEGEFLFFGHARDDTWAWTVGGVIYLSTTAGALTQTAPSSSGEQVQRLGVATHADRMTFEPSLEVTAIP